MLPVINAGDTSWMLISTGLVMLMIPALGFFEAGLIRSKNSLSIIMQTFSGLVILSILWFIIGFTLVYAPSSTGGISGGLEWTFFRYATIYLLKAHRIVLKLICHVHHIMQSTHLRDITVLLSPSKMRSRKLY